MTEPTASLQERLIVIAKRLNSLGLLDNAATIREAAALAQRDGIPREPTGTFHCPLCGRDTLHLHTGKEVHDWRTAVQRHPPEASEEGGFLPYIVEFERATLSCTCYSLDPKRNRVADDPIYEDQRTNAAYWGYVTGRNNAADAAPSGIPRDDARLLATAIRDSAVKAGIARPDVPLTGPDLLILCDDLANAALAQRTDTTEFDAACKAMVRFDRKRDGAVPLAQAIEELGQDRDRLLLETDDCSYD